MASPIGHALVGIGLAALAVPVAGVSPTPALWLGAVVASGLPDLDFIGTAFGLAHRRAHRGPTHSLLVLGVLVLAALVVSSSLENDRLARTRSGMVDRVALSSHRRHAGHGPQHRQTRVWTALVLAAGVSSLVHASSLAVPTLTGAIQDPSDLASLAARTVYLWHSVHWAGLARSRTLAACRRYRL